MKRSIWIVLGLLLLAGVWFFWPAVDRSPAVAHNPAAPGAVAPPGAAVPPGVAAPGVSHALTAASATASPAATNASRRALRLTNTSQRIGELVSVPHAILLENALLDTEQKLALTIPKHLQAAAEPGAYIVQARGVIDQPFRTALAGAGGQIVSYIPNNAYLVRLSSAGAAVLAGHRLVQAVLAYEPYYKVQPSLLSLAVQQKPLPPGTALTLGLFATDAGAMEREVEAMGAKIIGRDQSPFGPVLRVLPPADWTALARLPGVQVLEPARERVMANDLSRVATGVAVDTQTSSNYLGLSGLNVLVAVNDSGIDATHPDLTGRVFPNTSTDTDGHGTHVAGIIAGNGAQSTTVLAAQGSLVPTTNGQFRGKAPLARLYSGNSGLSDYVLQTNAAMQGALISNNSWDYRGAMEYDLAAASYDAATRDALPWTTGSQPVLFVFAAGNNGRGNDNGGGGSSDTVLSPGTAKNVITVGALEQPRNITNIVTIVEAGGTNQIAYWQEATDSSGQVAWYSARGNVGIGSEGAYGRFKPDVVAPGTFVISTRSAQWDTNAYFNRTNRLNIPYPGQLVGTNALMYYNVTVPANAVGVTIAITPNRFSIPFPADLPIYVKQASYPTASDYDFKTAVNGVAIPPDGGGSYLQQIRNNGFAFAVGNSTNVPVNYDLTVAIYTTNNVGDRWEVLHGLDDSLGGFYRYESGTSMSAAEVSGVLALLQDYFTNKLALTPSPALLKAMVINGARGVGSYSLAVTNGVNYQGWGLVNLANSLPLTTTNLAIPPNGTLPAPLFFTDQSTNNALATGDSHTYLVNVNTNGDAPFLSLKATLVWTDPCGDPMAATKLVNNLDLVITNLDTLEVYYGNDISSVAGYNLPVGTNGPPRLDTINNVENIILPPLLAGRYSVTVAGRMVNVNAVSAQTNNVVQDYALVITCGAGEVPDALTSVQDLGVAVPPSADLRLTFVTSTNAPLFNQFAGASTPLLGTNTVALGTNTVWGSQGQVTVGLTNQWHFYVVTNTGPSADFTNAAFITFQSTTLSLPRMGVFADSVANATRPEADIDLYVSMKSSLTNLSPEVLAECLAGTADSRSSLGQGGTEFCYYTDSVPGDVYYIAVKSEDQMAAEYAFLPVFTSTPFSQLDENGNQIVNGLLLPVGIPDGDNAKPGVTNLFALAIYPMDVGRVTVTNLIEHENFGDLFGALSFGGQSVVLNNHDGYGNTYGTAPLVYDDSRNPVPGTQPTDGPGSLVDYRGKSSLGPWIMTQMDNSQTQTGQVSRFSLVIQPHRDLTEPGTTVTVPPLGWFVDYVEVPPGYTNLTFYATNMPPTIQPRPLEMYEKFGNEPTFTDYDQMVLLTNCLIGTYPSGRLPGNSISVGPPLANGLYFVGIYNPDPFVTAKVFISAKLGIGEVTDNTYTYTTNPATALLDDAVSANSVFVAATQVVSSVNIGMVVNTPRVSDLTFTLVSPTGQRVLLMENRGGYGTTNIGHLSYTNVSIPGQSYSGSNAPVSMNYGPVPTSGILQIEYNFYVLGDSIDVYYQSNNIFSSSNPRFVSGAGTFSIPYGPGIATNFTIVINENGNPATNTRWDIIKTVVVQEDVNYLTFTDDTNLAQVPIKFAIPPYNLDAPGTNFAVCDFESTTNGTYRAPASIYDPFGFWTVPTNLVTVSTVFNGRRFVSVTNVVSLTNNMVSVVTDSSTAQSGSNYLALGQGTLTRNLSFITGRKYSVTYAYRGPGITGWWRGEGNASDSSNPESAGNNGALIGRFNFPDGAVGQAFQFEDQGDQFGFAGTNTYVQIPQSASLDVGKGGGFTVEGWINPTNLARPQPLVEWLAHVPTNAAVSNLVIQAGPFLNRATGHYYYMLGATNWPASEAWATALGGHLVTLDTANEQNWVFDNFATYGGANHNLWIGLTNALPQLGWVGGLTNVTYTNWLSGQPNNGCGTANRTFMLGGTNAQSGLWVAADLNGFTCGSSVTNLIYGVVEVDEIQTNGVQFWVSVTNSPAGSNTLVGGSGCLYANVVDTNFVSHEIYSAPGLLQSNVYQHVALTFDTNSGLARLFLDGTNVATTNLFLATGVFAPFVPKTDGDVLLGRDMTRTTNNYYGGRMDEVSIYNRALSDTEISAIYRVTATATNGLTGKFDPAITPALGLAEARVSLGTTTNTILGENHEWKINGFTFTATTNSLPLQITGLQPGMLLDSFSIAEAPQSSLYYLPEQALDILTGSSAYGNWTLQVWDNRVGAYVTNLQQLVSWRLSFVLESNAVVSATLPPQTPVTSTVAPGQTVYYSVPVPAWAQWATNILVSATGPVDLLFNSTNVPDGSGPGDITLLTASTGGRPAGVTPVLPVNVAPLTYQAGTVYYLGVRNPGIHAATVVLEVDYDMIALSNGVPQPSVLTTNLSNLARYFSYDVSTNAYEVTFELLQQSGNADLVVSKGVPLPTLLSSDYGSFNVSNLDESIYVLTNSSPVPLAPGRWYLGVIRRDSGPLTNTVLVKELSLSNAPPTIIDLTNGVPVNFTAGPGAALTNFFRFPVANAVSGLRFELYNLSGNGDLTVQRNALPLAPPFFQTSQNSGRSVELVFAFTNSTLTNLTADWYLGVPNNETVPITYTIVAVVETNSYFPAFPGASGSGGGAVGGRIGSVYHVTSLADSGPGTLRDAVKAANRTVVFDLSGTINLAAPLVITNSYLTIAGQTAPGGGITVAGEMTTLESAHDVVIRSVRFRRGAIDDSLMLTNVVNVIADHVSTEWSDTVMSTLNSSNVTVQWSIIADSLYVTNNPPPLGSNLRHGAGALSFHHNLYANNYSGSPRLGDNLSLDFVNNVIYNWGLFSGLSGGTNGGTNLLNYTGNYLIAGPDTAKFGTNYAITNIAFWGGSTNTWIFQTNNFIDSNINRILDGANTKWAMFTNDYTPFEHPFPLLPVPTDEAFIAYERVLAFAGVNMGMRDSVDADIVAKVRNQTGTLISTPPASGMVAWWKAEGNAQDSVGANNGTLMGGLGFAPGKVRQAFNFKDTNGYVFVPASSQMNVGAGRGFTVEAWISPSNVVNQMPLVGWDTNAGPNNNVLAGPILNPANGHYYYLLQINNWTGSEAWARQLGGHLVTIDDAAENSWVLNTFSLHGGVYRDLWTGLYDPKGDTVTVPAQHATNFVWADGSSSIYRNWRAGEPNNGSFGPTREYWTYIFSADQGALAGRWNDLPDMNNDTGGHFISGVVELTGAPGVYLWTSVTWPGGGGAGCLYADVVDSTNGSHRFSSPMGMIQLNGYQHVALTYDQSTGIASLYLNGAVVANTNLGVLIPKTTGDVLLGKNAENVYSGSMDEVSIYKRALSQKEIQSIYNAGSAGKFATVSGSSYLDTDQDGIPDFWESTFTPNLVFIPSNNNDRNGDGYTDLEEYNNWLAAPHALTVTTNPVSVDLMQQFGKTGNLSFSVTNGVNGSVYLTNVLGSVTNTGPFSNSIAVFTPTNTTPAFNGYASFGVSVTNNDTVAYFGPVPVSVMVSAVPVAFNTNVPPVIITLTNKVAYSNTNYAGSDFYKYTVTNSIPFGSNAVAVLFEVTNASGPVTLVARYGLPLPSLSSYDYLSANPGTANEQIAVSSNSVPVVLTNGDWYLAVVNVSGSPVTYTIVATTLYDVQPPIFTYPTNNTYTNLETTPFTLTCTATDVNVPVLPLTYALVNQPANVSGATNVMAIDPVTGVITWTPSEAQGPSTNTILVSVANAAFYVTNSFTVIVTESNLPPVLSFPPDQSVTVPDTLVVVNTAKDPDFPANTLSYMLDNPPVGAAINSAGVITWTPTLAQGGADYLITTVVTDNNPWAVNAQSLSATNTFRVTVQFRLPPGGDSTNTVPAGGINWFTVNVPTNAVIATNLLIFATNLPVNLWFSTQVPPTISNPGDVLLLANATNGASVLSTTSTPARLIPGQTYYLGVQNTNTLPVTYALRVDFILLVTPNIIYTNLNGTNGFLLTWFAPSNNLFYVQWTKRLAPVSWNTFTNIVRYNVSAFTDPQNTQFNFFDDGSQTAGFDPTRFYRVVHGVPPGTITLPPQTNQTVGVSSSVTVTNTAKATRVGAVLTYSLVNPPAGATISTNGIINWPNATPAGLAARFTTLVTDDNVPPLTATNSFTVFVTPLPAIATTTVTATNVTMTWSAPANNQFQVQWATNLAPAVWFTFPNLITSPTGTFSFVDTNAPLLSKFYRLLLLP